MTPLFLRPQTVPSQKYLLARPYHPSEAQKGVFQFPEISA